MGKAILYCFQCSTLLREDDFASGKAVRSGDHVACAACAPKTGPAPAPPKRNVTSTRLPAGRPKSSPAIPRPVEAPAPANRNLLILAGGAAALLAVLIILGIAWSGSASEPPPKPEPAPEAAPPRPAPESPGLAALEAARRWSREHPQDLAGQMREFQNVVFDWERTPSAAEAQKELARLKTQVQGLVDNALAALELELEPALGQKDYAAAIKQLEGAARRLPYPEWELARSKREHEIRDLARQQPEPPKLPAEKKPEAPGPALVGHWTFDEGKGGDARDSSGNGHTGKLKSGAAWAPGRIGSGLRCDGRGGYVQLPSSPLLDSVQEDSFTLAAWYKADAVPAGEPDANDSAHGILVKRGWHEGLVYNREGRFILEHWIAGDRKATGGTWGETFAAGTFHHVAGVVDRASGKSLVYVDGRHQNTNDWAAGTAARDFKSETWRIGIGAPGAPKWAYPAAGVIDDVRIYRRALTAVEVQALYDLAR